MRYLGRLIVYMIIFALTFSVSAVIVLRFIPVTVTPLKVVRLLDKETPKRFAVRSNWVPLDEISPIMVKAVVTTEDNHFLSHRGFDWDAIKKAREDNRTNNRMRGGSTISQQTAKNVFCLPARNWLRKGVEAYYTTLIELVWGKKRIMEVYLNVIETGRNRYGVEAAARYVYGKTAAELNMEEASMIATVLPSPLRMKLEKPSDYMVKRAARVRKYMNRLPPVDFDNPPERKSRNGDPE